MLDKPIKLTLLIVALLATTSVAANDFTLDWYTVDGGGEMWTTGGEFELSGTIGQPDASSTIMTGGDFELSGGFWPGVPAYQLADMNCDGYVNFSDVDPFVYALLGEALYYAQYPNCDWWNADCNQDGFINWSDVDPFVECLLYSGCP